VIPLVVHSRQNGYLTDLTARTNLPLELVDLRELYDPSTLARHVGKRVVFMRTGYEHELHADTCRRAVEVENAFKRHGARIVNPVRNNMKAHRKDQWYRELRLLGVSVPTCISNPTPYEILAAIASGELSFPIVYRLADASTGRGMHLVTDRAGLFAVYARFPKDKPLHRRIATGVYRGLARVGLVRRGPEAARPFYRSAGEPYYRTAAVEYVEDRIGPYFARVRLVVVGESIDMRARVLSTHWISNVTRHATAPKEMLDLQQTLNEHYEVPARLREDTLRIGRLMGLECYAVDALTPPNRDPVIVDVNPLYFFMESDDDRDPPHYRGHFQRVAEYLHRLPI
jgi:glutathione synthase/RimK-type ligase-like ATP-grasp enzyme